MTTGDPARTRPRLKSEWAPSPTAFRQFLTWLDGGVDSNGERYLEMRRRLEQYIPDPPARYCYIVARFVLLESLRSPDRRLTQLPADIARADGPDLPDRRLDCLERCLSSLSASDCELIVEYYSHNQRTRLVRRRQLAARCP